MTEDFKRTREFPTDEALLQRIEYLRVIAKETDPSGETFKLPVSVNDDGIEVLADVTVGKDRRAAEVLTHAAIIFDEVAGWAVNHLAGRILNETPAAPPFVRPADNSPPDPGLVRAGYAASQPGHEAKGATYEFGVTKYDRPLLAEILMQMAPAFPPGLAFEASDGLYALSLNEVSPLYERWPSGTRWRKEYAKQFALLYLAFHTALEGSAERGGGEGIRKDPATRIQGKIAGVYGFKDISQIRHWRTSGRQKFRAEYGLGGLEYRLLDAEQAGAKVRAWHSRPASEHTDRHDRRVVEFYEHRFRKSELLRHGAMYKPPKKRT